MGFPRKSTSSKSKRNKTNKVVQKTRKELRKEKRQQKKVKRAVYYQKKNEAPGKFVLNPDRGNKNLKVEENINDKSKISQLSDKLRSKCNKEEKKRQKFEREMKKQRKIQLEQANAEEDKVIKHLEKQLKLNKRKSKTVPKSFASDGLDYLLDFCDDENRKIAIETEKQLLGVDSGSEFEEDFVMSTNISKTNSQKEIRKSNDIDSDNESDYSRSSVNSEEEMSVDDETNKESLKNNTRNDTSRKNERNAERNVDFTNSDSNSEIDDESEVSSSEKQSDEERQHASRSISTNQRNSMDKRKVEFDVIEDSNKCKKNKKVRKENDIVDETSEMKESNTDSSDSENMSRLNENEINDEHWEDIYGRKRDKDGNVISDKVGKYVPPAARFKGQEIDSAKNEKLARLRKQLKGLLNRLAEHNMHSIASQIDELYMSNSRNDMNEMLLKLMMESIVGSVLTPDRLITEHMMLIAVLHANVGTEVGAHFLQNIVKKLDEMLKEPQEVENKELDNVTLMISHLYNFKVCGSQLLYQILGRLSEKFLEKEIELILLVLRTVGFVLRKDDPIALKELILNLQQKAPDATCENSRIKFMLDILLAIKNNNMTKIPQYDPSHVEHLKKLMKNFIRKGNYVTQLNISLDDLLRVDERGKWWIVGSAWKGNDISKPVKNDEGKPLFSQKILNLARKQRMNTDVRRNIFCILMTAEDYLDAFENLHHLGLKDQQEREVIYVIINCCLQEKQFNPYYAILAQKFCDYDRKYQMTIQYTLWDKLKALDTCTSTQLTNLARFLTHLFIEKGLSFSVLKVIQFGELDKHTVRLLRQIMLGILLHEDAEACAQVFERISLSPQLQTFREGLRLFINHFLIRNTKVGAIPETQIAKLTEKAELVDKILTTRGSKIVF